MSIYRILGFLQIKRQNNKMNKLASLLLFSLGNSITINLSLISQISAIFRSGDPRFLSTYTHSQSSLPLFHFLIAVKLSCPSEAFTNKRNKISSSKKQNCFLFIQQEQHFHLFHRVLEYQVIAIIVFSFITQLPHISIQ